MTATTIRKKINKLYVLLALFSFMAMQAQEHTFSKAALNDVFLDLKGDEVSFQSIIEANKGKTVLLDIWASWCKDCVVGMPTVKDLQKDFPDVAVVFISLDKNEASWKKGIERFKITEGSHYWANDGWKSELFQDIDLDWIPRYMVLDAEGNIKLYKAIKASDKAIVEQLRNSKS
ncbi:TlpA family protein disulfide reductase [Maribacter luteus]|uniref:Redoxin family protein n=1 Tax=Maribacter luteus TaxID=2594478 RepID=A0A6I2MQF0_9FLAO|nr:TlpA disulfide reductase family protein [Maribacter luteus]MRX65049.1 redoxin family protein [Maribacter luteus]